MGKYCALFTRAVIRKPATTISTMPVNHHTILRKLHLAKYEGTDQDIRTISLGKSSAFGLKILSIVRTYPDHHHML